MARKYTKHKDTRYPEGAIFRVSGDATQLWIRDYNVRVSTCAEVLEQPNHCDKKVFVRLDSIDGEENVNVYVKKSCLLS